ncbi:MAG: amino acid adenylation domain-containing protein [Leptolyngbya sp. IPPAS B-1204]
MTDLHQQIAALTPAQRALFEQRLKQQSIQPSVMPILPRAESSSASSELPLSFAQQRLWFIQQLDPASIAYNVPCGLRLRGNLNITALTQTLSALIQRHETLRTTFQLNADKQPVQVIAMAQPQILPIVDLTALANPAPTVEQLAQAAAQRPFDLRQPLLRCLLLRLQPTEHVLLLTTHHIISDRWSVGVFLRELSQLYDYFHGASGHGASGHGASGHGASPKDNSSESPLPALPIQYADWAIWQRQTLQGEHLETQIRYWRQQLQDLTGLELPTDYPRPALPSYRGATYPIQLSASLSAALKRLSAEAGVTLFMLLLAAFQTLLHRYTQQHNIAVGTDVANRERPETRGLIGLFVNTLVLRGDLSGNPSFRELLQRTRRVMAAALSHQDLPFEKLVELLNPERHLSQMMPLFQVKLDLQLAEVKPLTLTDLEVERLPFDNGTVKYDLRLNLQDSEQGINGQVEYSTDLFDPARIARLVEHFRTLLEAVVTNPNHRLSELPLLTPAEQQHLQQCNPTQQPYPNHLIHHWFDTQAAATPDRIALLCHSHALSYHTLACRANQLAHYLQSLGAAPDTRIGLCLPRTPALVIALLAILKAGAAYVPLDPSYPPERLQWMVHDAEISILVTHSELPTLGRPELLVIQLDTDWDSIARCCPDPVATAATPADLAYLIYTSGSTGVPKGVAIEHRNTVAFLHWVEATFSPEQLAAVLASTSVCFDLSVFELLAPLSRGGTVVLADSALPLAQLPHLHHLTLLNTVPSVAQALLQLQALPPNLTTLTLAGEALSSALVEQVYHHSWVTHLYNLYGPSEDTTYSTAYRIPLPPAAGAAPPIGTPIAHSQVYLLDAQLQLVPLGVVGEIYLAGAGLARGYWKRAELTAERFVPNPFGVGTRLYRTGDRGRYRADGCIEYLGRLDQQVKLRGVRIELGEIESLLAQHPQVREAVVAVQADQLVAYWVTANRNSANADPVTELRQFISARLPAYMVPAIWIALPELPRLPNGKLNRSALPQPTAQSAQSKTPPATAIEQTIAAIWQTELQIDAIGRDDNFFELGGHSLLAMTVVARISETLGIELPLRTLFQSPTVAGLAAEVSVSIPADILANISSNISTRISQPLFPTLTPDPDQRHQPFPLTEIQQAYWIGRHAAFELGNVSTHGYREIEVVGLTVAQVEQAMQRLINRHEMLRVIVQPDGQQRILAEVPPYRINTLDLRGYNATETTARLIELRNQLSHQVLPTDTYPLFDIQAVLLDQNKIRFCISFDVLIGDAWSFQLLGQELAQILQHPERALPPLSLSFRDYVLAERSWRTSEVYQRSLDYWQQRLANLPLAPELPLIQAPSAISEPHFSRRSGQLDAPVWQRLKQQASQHNLTPSGLLLAVFAEVLSAWSRTPQFTLNLTLFNRLPLHPEVNQIVGDFTSSTLLAVDWSQDNSGQDNSGQDNSGQTSFSLRAQRLQAQLWQDLDHRYVSGVEVLRQLARQQQQTTRALMPVVFTSILTHDKKSISANSTNQVSEYSPANPPWQSNVIYSLSQTSQVYLDHQVAEVNEALVFNWDTIDELFPNGLLDEMFTAYTHSLEQLAHQPALWQSPTFPSPDPKGRTEPTRD